MATDGIGTELDIGATKHKDTGWEKFRNNFPKSSDQEYKRFNPYDIMMDALDKAANGKNNLDDMFLDLMTAVLCMPFDQIRAVCEFKRRKRQEKKNGTKAQKDYDKMVSLLNLGIDLPEEEKRKIINEYLKAKGYDVTKANKGTGNNQETEKTMSVLMKAINDPKSLTEEERKIMKESLPKLGLDLNDVENLQEKFLDEGITVNGCKKLGEMFDVKYESDPYKFLADIGKKISEDPKALDKVREQMAEGVDTMVDAKTRERHDYLRKEIADMENAERDAEKGKTAKKEEYTEARLGAMLSEIGYDEKEIKEMKDKGQLNVKEVKKRFEAEEKKMNTELAKTATKEAEKTKATQQKTAAPQTKTTVNTGSLNTMAKNNGGRGGI